MDSIGVPKPSITLLGFSPKMDGRTQHGKKSEGITITVNGVPLNRQNQDDNNVCPEKVKLVGFNKSESFKSPTPSPRCSRWTDNRTDSMADAQKRQERLAELTEETREWFNNMRQQKEPWPPDSGCSDSFDRMQKFFDEAKEKFTKCSQDLFDQFVKENQERFSQMLEISELMKNSNNHHQQQNDKDHKDSTPPFRPTDFRMPNGVFGHESPFFARSPTDSNRTSTATRDSGFPSSHTSSPNSPHSPRHPSTSSFSSSPSSSRHPFDESRFSSFSQSPPFKTPFAANGSAKKEDDPFETLKNFNSFPRFPSFPIFPPTMPSPKHSPFMGRSSGAYQMSASKSTFEYCGNTNTYKFSTEQMSQSYNHTCDTVSESEDEEEEEDDSSITREPSEYDDTSTTEEILSAASSPLSIECDNRLDKVNVALFKIATELLTTERSYVTVLHLIDQVFQFRVDNENRAHNMFPQEVITQMFANIKSIYKLHHDFLLPQLEQRMASWDKEKKIGDIMKNFAPFLKMYTEYVKNFDNAMNTINFWASKQPRFNQILEEIQRLPECGNLILQHHMLSPIQRVPRYELLLKDYLKKLPDDSPDRSDTEKALHLVSTAANHSNDAMKKIDKFKKLLEIQDMIGGSIDLISPTRELVRDGKIIKISARSGDHQERHLFLFNDILLLCSQRLISNRVVSGPSYKVRAKLNVDGLQILEGDNLETANTFYICDIQKKIELYTQTSDEKEQWIQALCRVIQDLLKRKSSLKIGSEPHLVPDSDLGKRAPILLKMDNINSCMNCKSQFTAFKRRHHCRACGQVICHKCSVHKISLLYDDYKSNRVCNICYEMLSTQSSPSPENEENEKEILESPVRRGVLEVKATDDSVISSFLLLKTRGKTWMKRWFALHRDFVLYSFKGNEDQQAMTSTPVPGLTVAHLEKSDNIDREFVFKLFHKKKGYYFQAKDQTDMERWMKALEKAAKAELPS